MYQSDYNFVIEIELEDQVHRSHVRNNIKSVTISVYNSMYHLIFHIQNLK